MRARYAAVLTLTLLSLSLSGCFLPPAIATVTVDLGTLIGTGKTTTDYAISYFVEEDYRVWWGVAEASVEAIFYDEQEIMIAERAKSEESLADATRAERGLLAAYAQASIPDEAGETLSPSLVSDGGQGEKPTRPPRRWT